MQVDPETLTRRSELGRRLRELRRDSGMTQAELARAAGLGQASLSNYENARRDIHLVSAVRVAAALDITLGQLLEVPHILVVHDPEIARAVRILADSEELLTSIAGPRPPPPPRPPKADAEAQQGEVEATDSETEEPASCTDYRGVRHG